MEITLEDAIDRLEEFFHEDDGIAASLMVKLSWEKVKSELTGNPRPIILYPRRTSDELE